ncbi:hypothetical protein [Streptomyces flavidovirens]|uniref:hypothetical protein n=1 Tax=Streptomyces flavidovirens TaxID=67298 RepID=UPI0036C4BECF
MTAATRIGGDRAYIHASTTRTYEDDLDLIAIEYALNGEPVQLTVPEKIRAAQILDGRGLDFSAIGRRVGSDRNTVAGWKAHGWQPPPVDTDPLPIDIGRSQHGRCGYTKGCRCRACKDGAKEASRQQRAKARAKRQAAA